MGIQSATVTVEYVNPPKEGKKKGSIKTAEGKYFGVFESDLVWFKPGGTYEIKFTDDEKYGTTVKKATSLDAGQNLPPAPPLQPQKPVGNGVGFRQVTLEDDLRMLRNAWGKAYIQASPERFDNEGAFTQLYMRLRQELSDAAVRTTSPQRRDDMADEIPY